MIKPIENIETVVSINDVTRLDFSRNLVTGIDVIDKIEIEPEAASGYVTVFDVNGSQDNTYLDWIYSVAGSQVISVRINGDTVPVTEAFSIEVLSLLDDNLFCTEGELAEYESEIFNYLPESRQSFKHTIRAASQLILGELYEDGVRDSNGAQLERKALEIRPDLKRWAIYKTLQLIFEDQVHAQDSYFNIKADRYRELAKMQRRKQDFANVDTDGDGTPDTVTTITPVFNGTLSRV